MGPILPSQKGPAQPPICGPCLLWPNVCMYQDATWYEGRIQTRRHCVRWGPSCPSPKAAQPRPQFSANVHCAQSAGWTNMLLGMQTGDFVFDADPAHLRKKAQSLPHFGPCLVWPNGWMDQDATWCEHRPRPRRHCVRWGPSSPPQKGGTTPISAHFIVAKRLDASTGLSPGDCVRW